MDKKQKSWLILGAILLLGIIVYNYSSSNSLAIFPSASNVNLFKPKFGYMQCDYGGQQEYVYAPNSQLQKCTEGVCGGDYTKGQANPFSYSSEYTNTYYTYFDCPQIAGEKGCRLSISASGCGYTYYYKQLPGISSWLQYTGPLSVPAGQTHQVKFICSNSVQSSNQNILPPTYQFTKTEVLINVLGSDRIPQRSLPDKNCLFQSNAAEQLKDTQPRDIRTVSSLFGGQVESIQTVTQLQLRRLYPIVIEWVSEPTLINPLGPYQDKDVLCKGGDGLYEILRTGTEGATDPSQLYFIQSNILKRFVTGDGSCCGAGQCSGDLVCEAYSCVAKPVSCPKNDKYTGSQCYPKNTKTGQTEERVIDGRFYTVDTWCDTNGCEWIQKTEVKCLRSLCPSDKPFCDYSIGCYNQGYKTDCPPGQCCQESNNYYARPCPTPQTCCPSGQINDPTRGFCKDTCVPDSTDKPENQYANGCKDAKDNDNDGRIDNADPDCYTCQVGSTIYADKNQVECCALNGGKWITETTSSWFGLKSDKKEYCDTTNYTLWIVLGIIALLAIIGGGVYIRRKK